MTQPSGKSRSTRVSTTIKAPREAVYRAFLVPEAVASWLSPDNVKGHVHIFEPRGWQVSKVAYVPGSAGFSRGKTFEDTDTFEGTFVELLPNAKIVEVFEFESQRPDFAGEMRITWSLADADGGTEVTVLCEGIPKGICLEDNEIGSRQSLRKLAAFVEHGTNDRLPP